MSWKSWPDETPAPLDGLNHNYCRNPDGELGGPWCYIIREDEYETGDSYGGTWKFCNVPKCEGKYLSTKTRP